MGIEIIASLSLSIAAIVISGISFVINYRRSRKTEQLKLCIDISARLDDAQSKILVMNEKLARNITTDQDLIKGLTTSLDLANMSYLSHWEFFAFLVNTKEIHEEKILGYYKDFFKGRVKLILDKYPQVRDNKERFNEIKKLLKEWDPKYYSEHFESE